MKLCFLPAPAEPNDSCLQGGAVDFVALRRPLGVLLAVATAALLHAGILVWYLHRPAPLPLTEATPLPMIDIALSSPTPPAATVQSQPAPTPPPPPKARDKPEPKPIKKAKPTPKAPRRQTAPVPEPAPIREDPPPAFASPPQAPVPVATPVAPPRPAPYTPASSNADYLNNPRPVYPNIARNRHWEGVVLLRVLVTAEGHCGEISIQRSSGHEALDESALEAVRAWRFVPAKRGDVAQASWVTVPIEFQLR